MHRQLIDTISCRDGGLHHCCYTFDALIHYTPCRAIRRTLPSAIPTKVSKLAWKHLDLTRLRQSTHGIPRKLSHDLTHTALPLGISTSLTSTPQCNAPLTSTPLTSTPLSAAQCSAVRRLSTVEVGLSAKSSHQSMPVLPEKTKTYRHFSVVSKNMQVIEFKQYAANTRGYP